MRISVIQINACADKAQNIAQARRLLGQAHAAETPDLLALPEMWSCLGGDHAAKFAAAEALPVEGSGDPGGEGYEFLSTSARALGAAIHGGSIAERVGDRLYNTSLLFDRDGREIARYRKIHLFDITAPDGAGYRESATYGAGERVVTADLGGLRIGLSICYDLRFPELYLALRRAGAELILVPAAFTLQTGRDHWEVLLRARAIETQCWIAAPATWGQHHEPTGPRTTFGHALICDPWGSVVAGTSDGPGWATARIDPELTARIRRNMPVLDHRRLA